MNFLTLLSIPLTSLAFVLLLSVYFHACGGEIDGVSYVLGEREGRRVIESSDGEVIPWISYTNSMDSSMDDWEKMHDELLEAGIKLYHLNLWDTSGQLRSHWESPFFSIDGEPVDEPEGDISWTHQVDRLIEREPDVRFFMRFGISTNLEWRREHIDHFQPLPRTGGVLDDGYSVLGSLASALYLERIELMIQDAVRWCESRPWRDRILGYSIFPYGEGTLELALFNEMFDNSPVMNEAFRDFIRDKYEDVDALREAWNDPTITFDDAAVPTREEWLEKKKDMGIMHWPEPEQVRRERDYFELQKILFHRFWGRVFDALKEATSDRHVIKGYDILKQHMQGWLHDADFDSKWQADTLDTYPHLLLASGSIGAGPLLDHPGLDILQTPGMYYNRAMGYAWEAEGLSDSLALRGKANFMEADMRTWVRKTWGGRDISDDAQITDAGVFMTPQEMRAGFNRTHAWALTRNQMYYFCSVCGGNWWYHEPPMQEHIQSLNQTPIRGDELPWSNIDDVICIVIDDKSALYEDFSSGFQHFAVYRQIEEGLALSGIPYRIHLLSDLERDNFPRYKAYLFPNLFRIDQEVEALLRGTVLRDGNVAIFGPGTGLTDGERLSPEGAERILGVPMELVDKRSSRRVILQNHGHPISERLQTLTYGDSYSYGPLLVPADQRLNPSTAGGGNPERPSPSRVTPLGAAFYHYFFDRPGPFAADFGLGASGSPQPGERGEGDYTVVFSPAVPLPPEFMRECARYAGVHVWSEKNAVVYASADLFALHTAGMGSYRIQLPRKAVVTDLLSGESTSEPVESLTVEAEKPMTKIFRLK